jgi:hypothetical protein
LVSYIIITSIISSSGGGGGGGGGSSSSSVNIFLQKDPESLFEVSTTLIHLTL